MTRSRVRIDMNYATHHRVLRRGGVAGGGGGRRAGLRKQCGRLACGEGTGAGRGADAMGKHVRLELFPIIRFAHGVDSPAESLVTERTCEHIKAKKYRLESKHKHIRGLVRLKKKNTDSDVNLRHVKMAYVCWPTRIRKTTVSPLKNCFESN